MVAGYSDKSELLHLCACRACEHCTHARAPRTRLGAVEMSLCVTQRACLCGSRLPLSLARHPENKATLEIPALLKLLAQFLKVLRAGLGREKLVALQSTKSRARARTHARTHARIHMLVTRPPQGHGRTHLAPAHAGRIGIHLQDRGLEKMATDHLQHQRYTCTTARASNEGSDYLIRPTRTRESSKYPNPLLFPIPYFSHPLSAERHRARAQARGDGRSPFSVCGSSLRTTPKSEGWLRTAADLLDIFPPSPFKRDGRRFVATRARI